jgi:hypothetical protein
MFAWTEERRGGRGGGSLYLIAAHAGHWDKFQTKIELACCVAQHARRRLAMWPIRRVSQGIPIAIEPTLSDQQGSAGHGIGRSGSAMAAERLSRTGCYSLSQPGVV